MKTEDGVYTSSSYGDCLEGTVDRVDGRAAKSTVLMDAEQTADAATTPAQAVMSWVWWISWQKHIDLAIAVVESADDSSLGGDGLNWDYTNTNTFNLNF